MAEEKENREQEKKQQNQNFVEKPILGIEQNLEYEDISSNVCSYALNAVIESDDGKFVLSRENSNKKLFDFSSSEEPTIDFYVVGFIYGEDKTVYYFLADETGAHCEIGYVNKNNVYTTVVNFPDLNFRLENQISGVYRLRLGCEKVIYWVEQNANNPIRYFNFDDPASFKDDLGNWSLDKFDLFYRYDRPSFTNIEVIESGLLMAGSYNIAIQLLDANLNATPWLFTTHPIPIYAAVKSSSYPIIIGSSHNSVDVLGGSLSHANKSIKVTVDDLDEDFTYYRLAFIEASSFNGNITKIHTTKPTPVTQKEYLFTGNPDELTSETTLDDIIFKSTPFSAEILEQHENMLIAARVKGKQYNLCHYQKYASKIATAYTWKDDVDALDVESLGNSKNSDTYWLNLNFQGFEVYALGIVYVFPDFETPAYHIPGRPKNVYFDFDTNLPVDIVAPNLDSELMPWNSKEVTPFTEKDQASYILDPDVEKWQIRDNSNRHGADWGRMCYFENTGFNYITKDNCDDDPIEDYWGVDFNGEALKDTPIRHHRFPSRFKESQISSASIVTTAVTILKITLTPADPPGTPVIDPTVGYYLYVAYDKNTVPTTYTTPFPPYIDVAEVNQTGGYVIEIDSSTVIPTTFDNVVIKVFDNDGVPTDVTTRFKTVDEVITVTKTVNTKGLRLIGIKTTNIEYPHPDIIGHYIVVAARDEFNRTVLDCGFGACLRTENTTSFDYTTFSYLLHNEGTAALKNIYSFLPKYNFQQQILKADYVRLENLIEKSAETLNGKEYDANGALFGQGFDIRLITRKLFFGGTITVPSCDQIYPILKQKDFLALSYEDNYEVNKRFYNLSWNNKILVNTLIRNFYDSSAGDYLPYISLGVNRPVHTNLFDMTYYRTHPNILVSATPLVKHTVWGGDTFVSNFQISNALFYKARKNFWKWLIPAILLTAATIVVFGPIGLAAAAAWLGAAVGTTTAVAGTIIVGATVAAAMGVITLGIDTLKNAYKTENLGNLVVDSDIANEYSDLNSILNDSDEAYVMEGLFLAYTESEINVDLRQHYTGLYNDQHNAGRFASYLEDFDDYFRDKFMVYDPEEADEDKKWTFRGVPYPEVYHYNPDYSRKNKETIYFALPLTYNCCSECIELFENRIHYSEQSFQEELVDHYRVFLPNNYRDVESEFGHITNVFKKDNRLHIHTTEGLWHLPTATQEKVNTDLVSYIGTGDFFSHAPMKILDAQNGICGSQHRWGTSRSMFGYLFVNELERKIYLYEERPIPISLGGIKNWSEEEIPLYLNQQWQELFGENYPLSDNPYHPLGIGFISIFDNKYNRYLVTKKDVKILQQNVYQNEIDSELFINYWDAPNTGATDVVNFNGLPAGGRTSLFSGLGIAQGLWSKTEWNATTGYYYVLRFDNSVLNELINNKNFGFSIRLVRTATTLEQTYADGTYCDNYIGNDGKTYKTVKIGTQVWIAENLQETQLRDLTAIPEITDNVAWTNLTTLARCSYDNNTLYGFIFGYLYNWYAVFGVTDKSLTSSNIWEIPSNVQWNTLSTYLGGNTVAGGKLKTIETGINTYYIVDSGQGYQAGDMIFEEYNFYIVTTTIVIDEDTYFVLEKISFNNPDYFENKSWTISYNKNIQNWVSWHSYLPNIYVSAPDTFSTILNDQIASIYEHNIKYSFGRFYDKYYPFIAEIVFNNPLQNFTWEHISLHVKARKYDAINQSYLENTLAFFDEAIFYNNRQSSGTKNLIRKEYNLTANYMLEQIQETLQEISVTKKENIWFINDIRDYIISDAESLFTKIWSNINPYYPIDKIPNDNIIDHNKNWLELEILRSKFLVVRLIKNSDINNISDQILFNYTYPYNVISNR